VAVLRRSVYARYMRRLNHKHVSALIGLIVSLALIALNYWGPASLPWKQTQPGYYKVSKFVDGDTIAVSMNGQDQRIRFIGVDTPETHDPRKAVQCYGMAAAAFTKRLIGTQPIRLEADPQGTNRDRYDRLLRYIYLQDGTLVNTELIKQGYGFAYTSFPFTKKEEFRAYQKQAMASNKGLWSTCQPTPNQYGGYTSNNAN
jgi:endonuclease YncB( thermonuclease family)